MDDDIWLKGKLAESIVEYMFLASGVTIFSSGAENYSELMRQMLRAKGIYDEDAKPIFNIPDFTIINGDHLEFVEVKYRQQGRFIKGDLRELRLLKKSWKPTIILVSNNKGRLYGKPIFQVIKPEYKLDSNRNPVGCKLPIEREDWHMSLEVYEECKRMVIASPIFADDYGYKIGDELP